MVRRVQTFRDRPSMASGGARVRSGPTPDPSAARRDRKRDDRFLTLPAAGTLKSTPRVPLDDFTDAERRLWRLLWKKPQASMWHQLGLSLQVAAYVRAFLESTEVGAPASLKTSVLRMEDVLGISAQGMRGLRWQIEEPTAAPAMPAATVTPRRLRAVRPLTLEPEESQ